jgi:hypothetical protein
MKITGQTRIPFSKHKNTRLRDLPDGFLKWVAEKLIDSDFHNWALAAKDELQRRVADGNHIKSLEEEANELLRNAGYDPRKL